MLAAGPQESRARRDPARRKRAPDGCARRLKSRREEKAPRGGRSRGGFPGAAGGRGRRPAARRAGRCKGAGARASPQPGGCSPRKFKSKAGVSRHRGDSAPGCFAPEPRNGRALEPEAITKQPERPVAGASPSRGPGNEGEGGGRGAAGEPAPAWEIPKPRGLAPPRASGLPAGVAGSFSASEALSPFFHPPRGLDSGANSALSLGRGIRRAHEARRASGSVEGGVHGRGLGQGLRCGPCAPNWELQAAVGKPQPEGRSCRVLRSRRTNGDLQRAHQGPTRGQPSRTKGEHNRAGAATGDTLEDPRQWRAS
nr:collagen alpha-2(I) chain-like [Manis javanica]